MKLTGVIHATQRPKIATRRSVAPSKNGRRQPLTLRDIGWTREEARRVRAKFASFAEDWDDPRMDVYDEA
jgi:hypothetical protein